MRTFDFDLKEEGEGPSVLLLPGSYATPAAWKGVRGALKTKLRMFSTSLPGYGTTPEIRPVGDDSIDHLVEFVGQVVEEIDDQVHVIGHSWGAQILLAAILKQRIKPLSLLCFEANPIFACPTQGQFPWRSDIDDMVRRFETALAHERADAASIIIGFYSHTGNFHEMPANVRAFCRSSAPTNLRDWRSAATFTPSFELFSSFDLPVTLVRGRETPVPVVDVNQQLCAHIAGAIERIVEGADHFLISTHPDDCAAILDAHMARV